MLLKKVKEYPWYFFKKEKMFIMFFKLRIIFGFTNINSTNLGDYSFEN